MIQGKPLLAEILVMGAQLALGEETKGILIVQ